MRRATNSQNAESERPLAKARGAVCVAHVRDAGPRMTRTASRPEGHHHVIIGLRSNFLLHRGGDLAGQTLCFDIATTATAEENHTLANLSNSKCGTAPKSRPPIYTRSARTMT